MRRVVVSWHGWRLGPLPAWRGISGAACALVHAGSLPAGTSQPRQANRPRLANEALSISLSCVCPKSPGPQRRVERAHAMIETLAAVGLASNIISFIDFGTKLFSRSRKIYNSADGAIDEHASLSIISSDLQKLSASLEIPPHVSGVWRPCSTERWRLI